MVEGIGGRVRLVSGGKSYVVAGESRSKKSWKLDDDNFIQKQDVDIKWKWIAVNTEAKPSAGAAELTPTKLSPAMVIPAVCLVLSAAAVWWFFAREPA